MNTIPKKKNIKNVFTAVLLMAIGFGLGYISTGFNAFKKGDKEIVLPEPSDNRTFFWSIYPELLIPDMGRKIEGSLTVRDLNDNAITLSRLLDDFPRLVVRYSKFDCHVCVDQVLDKLSVLFKGSENKVLLLVDGYSARELRIKYKERKMNFPIYTLQNKNLGLKLENKNLPFLFVFESGALEVNKIFVPFKEHGSETDQYLQNVSIHFHE